MRSSPTKTVLTNATDYLTVRCAEWVSVGIKVAGTFTGTVTFTAQVDEVDRGGTAVTVFDTTGTAVSSVTAPGIFIFQASGYAFLTAIYSAKTSGSPLVTLTPSASAYLPPVVGGGGPSSDVTVLASALPAGAATAAKQPGIGVAGTASADVMSVQGIDGGTMLPISGTVTANIGTVSTLALDASVTGLQVSQGTGTSGQKGSLTLGAVTTAAPTYTTAQSSPLSLDTNGNLRVSASGTVASTQSGTWTVQPGNTANTTPWLTSIQKDGVSAAVTVGNALKVDASDTIQPVVGTFWQGTQPVSVGSLPLPTSAATSTKQSDGSQKTQVVDGSGNVVGSTANALDINIKSGSVTANAGTNLNTSALALDATLTGGTQKTRITDGTSDVTIITGSADGTSATSNRVPVQAHTKAYNGTTWDLVRAGLTGVKTTFVGILNTLPQLRYNSTLPTLSDGNVTELQGDASGRLQVAVNSRSSAISQTPTVTASSAYTAGNEVGGLLTFASSVGVAGSGVLHSIRVTSKTVQTGTLKLYLFNVNPSNTTWTDKTAPSINSADVASCIGVWSLTSPDSGLGTHTIYNSDAIGKAFSIASGTSLYGILVTSGTPTWGSTSDVTVVINVLQD